MSPKFKTVTSDLSKCLIHPPGHHVAQPPLPILHQNLALFGLPLLISQKAVTDIVWSGWFKASLFSNVFARHSFTYFTLYSVKPIVSRWSPALWGPPWAGQRSLVALRNWAAKSWEVLGFGSFVEVTSVCGWILCISYELRCIVKRATVW